MMMATRINLFSTTPECWSADHMHAESDDSCSAGNVTCSQCAWFHVIIIYQLHIHPCLQNARVYVILSSQKHPNHLLFACSCVEPCCWQYQCVHSVLRGYLCIAWSCCSWYTRAWGGTRRCVFPGRLGVVGMIVLGMIVCLCTVKTRHQITDGAVIQGRRLPSFKCVRTIQRQSLITTNWALCSRIMLLIPWIFHGVGKPCHQRRRGTSMLSFTRMSCVQHPGQLKSNRRNILFGLNVREC